MEPLQEDEEIKFSDLQQTPSWKFSVNLYNYQEFWYYELLLKGVISFQKNFKPQPTDTIICTTPKSGTTWLKAVCTEIQTRKQCLNLDSNLGSPLLSRNPHDIVTCQEIRYANGKTRDPQIPMVHTHVPFSSLPKSILNSNCKIIYICRDPKDVLISQFFFTARHGDEDMIPLEEVYEKFCNGVSSYGPFWDHVLGYWKASLEFPERVLFLKYEDLKKDACFNVKKIADFMGYGFSSDELEGGIVESIVEMCSFDNLRNLEVNKSTRHDGFQVIGNQSYFRKGKVGDWKNYLTVEMAERIDQLTYRKFNGFGLSLQVHNDT